MPTSLSEAWDVAKSLGKSTSSSVTESLEDSEDEESKKVLEIDPLHVITEAHDVATAASCHCPIGACMGHHEESPPSEIQLPQEEFDKSTEGPFVHYKFLEISISN